MPTHDKRRKMNRNHITFLCSLRGVHNIRTSHCLRCRSQRNRTETNEECAACLTTRQNVLKTGDFAYIAVSYWKGNRTKLLLLLIFMGSTGRGSQQHSDEHEIIARILTGPICDGKLQSLLNNECGKIFTTSFPIYINSEIHAKEEGKNLPALLFVILKFKMFSNDVFT